MLGPGLTCRRALPDGIKPGGGTERNDCVCRRPDSLGAPPQPVVGHNYAFPHGALQPTIKRQQQRPQQGQRLAQQLLPLCSLPCKRALLNTWIWRISGINNAVGKFN